MISDAHKTNFETLKVAFTNGDIALMEVYERIGGKPVTMLCAVYQDEEEQYNFVPLAQMCEGNPYDSFVTEKENVAKYKGVGESIVRLEDRAFLDTTKNAIFIEENWAKAYTLLKDHLGEDDAARAQSLSDRFVEEVVSQLPEEWSLSALEIDAWIKHAENPDDYEADGAKPAGEHSATQPDPGGAREGGDT